MQAKKIAGAPPPPRQMNLPLEPPIFVKNKKIKMNKLVITFPRVVKGIFFLKKEIEPPVRITIIVKMKRKK
jgi:hypothetical protein